MPARSMNEILQSIDSRSMATNGGCRLWQGELNHKGYGRIKVRGRTESVHRVVFASKGKIPDGLHVLHRCDRRNCVNYEHLFLGTNQDNMTDKCLKNRSGIKLTIDKVKEIRGMASTGFSQAEIARRFGVNQSNISRAVCGDRWSHVATGGV